MTRDIKWDIHEKDAPRESGRWAVTDRGWLFGCGQECCNTSLGHYLDYGPDDLTGQDRDPAGNVHAVAIRHTKNNRGCITHTQDAQYFRTPSDARAWLEACATGQMSIAGVA